MVGVLATASLLRAFQPRSSDSIHSVYSGLRPIYATQSHPKTLLPTHIQSLGSAKLRSGTAPAPKASGRVSAKRELRSSRKAPRGSPNARSFLFPGEKRPFHLRKCVSHFIHRGEMHFGGQKMGKLQVDNPPQLFIIKDTEAAAACARPMRPVLRRDAAAASRRLGGAERAT